MENKVDIARAWKDAEYRKTLTPEQLAQLPENPAGESELSEEDLGDVAGGFRPTNAVCYSDRTRIQGCPC
ncbi:MAG TPA: mersacidin/lichenicidin family type 2 lantibiotic [Chloroflexia bacterium]|nr:mersacidin/lichenicidin family type 2 lantibiotic [Chloroflexia bacterium]